MPPAPPPIMPMPPALPPDAVASPASGTGPMAPDWARSMLTQASPPPPPAPMAPPKIAPLTAQKVDQDLMAGQNAQLSAIDESTAAKSKIAQAEGTGKLAAEDTFQTQRAADLKIDADATAKTNADFAAYQKKRDELANTKINPDDRSTLQKITGAIAIGLGGFAAAAANRGAGGGQNLALQIIQAKIAKSVEAQVQNLKTKKEAVDAEGSDIKEGRVQNRVDSLDRLAKAQAMRDHVLREIDAQVSMLGTASAKAEGDQLKAGVVAAGAKEEQAVLAQRHTEHVQDATLGLAQSNAKFEHGLQLGQFTRQLNEDITKAPGVAAETQLHQAEAYKALHPTAAGKGATNPLQINNASLPDGSPVIHDDKTIVKEANIELGKHQAIINAAHDLLEKRAQYGLGDRLTPGSNAYKELDAAHGHLVDLMKKEMGSRGLPDEEVKQILDRRVGDTTGFRDNSPRWQALIQDEIKDANSYVKQNVNTQASWMPAPRTADAAAALKGNTGGTIPDTAPSGQRAARGFNLPGELPQGPVTAPANPLPYHVGGGMPQPAPQINPFQFPPPEWLR